MKNPLRKRYIRELKGDLGKYIVIFLLLVISIGFCSGFKVADNSMIVAYNESFEKYNIEDGHFVTERKMNRSQADAVSEYGISTYENFYYETDFDNDTTIRIFKKRSVINLECLMDGAFPENKGEIAIDRMFADNNGIVIGDTLTTKTGESYVVTGLVALSDYSTMFQDNSDIMFDAVTFGVAVVCGEQFDEYAADAVSYCYAWKYDDTSVVDSDDERDISEDLMYSLNDDVTLEEFVPRYENQAITFTGEDMGSDGAMIDMFLYIIVVIIGFVFAATTRDTITKEANVIGTLRASGYTSGELVRHYMVMPIIVTLVSAVVGNIFGYTAIKDLCAAAYYGSYSLPTYVTLWNADALVQTTLIPCAIMAVITWLVLWRSLSLSPLKFLRGDFSRRKNKKAMKLSHGLPFMSRFRMRVIFQNIPNYLILFVGILFGSMMLMFGLAMPELLITYQDTIGDNMLAKYQTILSVPSNALDEDKRLNSLVNLMSFSKAVETETDSAEKFSVYQLKTQGSEEIRSDEIMLYGIEDDSDYVTLPGDGVYISYMYADKYEIGAGDEIELFEEYEDKSYTFTIDGVIDYRGAICVFMPMDKLNETFDLDDDFFAGYFSDTEITDIDEKYIGSVIDYDSLTKVSRQLMVSMGSMMYILDVFCVIMFVILMYLLSKMIIEKSSKAISLTKILGYSNSEISALYVRSITIVTVICIFASLPLCYITLVGLFRIMLKSMMSGWLIIDIKLKTYIIMVILGVAAYVFVAFIEMRKIKKIPMDQALKVVE